MDISLLNEIDTLYERYGYEIKRNHNGARVYLYTKSIYNGADILAIDYSDIETLKKEYSAQGYAVKERVYDSFQEAEQVLFSDFFKAEGVTKLLQRRYNDFVSKLMQNLPYDAKYEYINCQYEAVYLSNIENDNIRTILDLHDETIIEKTVRLIQSHNGPLFIIIEAAAGYGKTCTAYEILNEFLNIDCKKLPFFTELSRDRKATIFKHILLNEIEQQFSNSITSSLVVSEIKSGKIPLIIDGFDELISKDFSFQTSDFEQVESMLSTIVDMLSENAKIVITSRKTAIFNSQEFHAWMEKKEVDYTLVRINISEPRIEDWLNVDQMEIVNNAEMPLQSFANPVLLTYLRYIPVQQLRQIFLTDKSVVDNYIDFLLRREMKRQGLPMEPELQLRVFKKLVRLFTEFDIKTTEKEDLQELLLEYNKEIFKDTLKRYTSDTKPTVLQLANTLTNHAFLDRKDDKNIGFVNEFIFGTLIGENLINNDYQRHRPKFYEEISQSFSVIALQSFRVQHETKRKKLWQVYDKNSFNYDQQFYFKSETDLKKSTERKYTEATFYDFDLDEFIFSVERQFVDSTFTNCIFRRSIFNPNAFTNCSFVKCKFYDCVLDNLNNHNISDCMIFFGCYSNNEFEIDNSQIQDTTALEEGKISLEIQLLTMHLKVGTYKGRFKTLSQIREDLKAFNPKEIDKTIKKLEQQGYLIINGNNTHITPTAVAYLQNLSK